MRLRKVFASLCLPLYLASTDAWSQEDLPIPPDEFVYCTTCHGVQLMGNPVTKAPRLSGVDVWYVEHQLRSFKNEWRGKHEADEVGMEMQPMAAALSDDQIREVAQYVRATRSVPPTTTISGDAENGRRLYGSCGACHGLNGEGNEALGSPSLTHSNDWYLFAQLQNFKNGSRGGHSADSYGMQMRAAAQLLPDDDAIADVVSYISTLAKNP